MCARYARTPAPTGQGVPQGLRWTFQEICQDLARPTARRDRNGDGGFFWASKRATPKKSDGVAYAYPPRESARR